MAYLKFLDGDKLHKVKVTLSNDIVTLSFAGEKVISTAGFNLYLDEEGTKDIGGESYHGYTTVYRDDDTTDRYNGYQLSSDGSVYVEPEPLPEPEVPDTTNASQYVSDRQLIEEQGEAILELAELLNEQNEATMELAEIVSAILDGEEVTE